MTFAAEYSIIREVYGWQAWKWDEKGGVLQNVHRMEGKMISTKETGKRIRRLLADGGISVREVQERIGLESSQAVYKWLHGKSLPSLENALALSRLLGINMEELLAGDLQGSGRKESKEEISPVYFLEIHRPERTGREYLRYQRGLSGILRDRENQGKLTRRRELKHLPEYTRRKLLRIPAARQDKAVPDKRIVLCPRTCTEWRKRWNGQINQR